MILVLHLEAPTSINDIDLLTPPKASIGFLEAYGVKFKLVVILNKDLYDVASTFLSSLYFLTIQFNIQPERSSPSSLNTTFKFMLHVLAYVVPSAWMLFLPFL